MSLPTDFSFCEADTLATDEDTVLDNAETDDRNFVARNAYTIRNVLLVVIFICLSSGIYIVENNDWDPPS
jgi:hypothetical protein